MTINPYVSAAACGLKPWACLAMAVMAAALVGCDDNDAPVADTAPVRESTPQAQFDRIVESLRDQLETSDGGSGSRFAFRDETGAGSAAYSFEVEASPKVVEPAEEGEPYRAAIKITLKTSYSSLPPEEDEQDAEGEKVEAGEQPAKEQQGWGDEFGDPLDGSGLEVLDEDLIAGESEGFKIPRIDRPSITSRTVSADNVTVYNLVYQNNRWSLAGPPKADAPESANTAVQLAIKRQG